MSIVTQQNFVSGNTAHSDRVPPRTNGTPPRAPAYNPVGPADFSLEYSQVDITILRNDILLRRLERAKP
jgi:hypothetical protein